MTSNMTSNMTGKKKWWFTALGAGALCAVALPLFAGSGCEHGKSERHGHGMMSERAINKISNRLKLDAGQRDALHAAAGETRAEMRDAQKQLRESRGALRELDPDAPDYGAKVAELAETNGKLATELTMLAAGIQAKFAEVLTDEQEQQFKKFLERRGKRHHDDDS